jgi:hypothetical protein
VIGLGCKVPDTRKQNSQPVVKVHGCKSSCVGIVLDLQYKFCTVLSATYKIITTKYTQQRWETHATAAGNTCALQQALYVKRAAFELRELNKRERKKAENVGAAFSMRLSRNCMARWSACCDMGEKESRTFSR